MNWLIIDDVYETKFQKQCVKHRQNFDIHDIYFIKLKSFRLDSGMRGKEKGGAPPIKSLLHGSSPAPSMNSPFSTPLQVRTL